jgi:hypothetical protein
MGREKGDGEGEWDTGRRGDVEKKPYNFELW